MFTCVNKINLTHLSEGWKVEAVRAETGGKTSGGPTKKTKLLNLNFLYVACQWNLVAAASASWSEPRAALGSCSGPAGCEVLNLFIIFFYLLL